jgi:DNA-binding MarR family transcriptional regulator
MERTGPQSQAWRALCTSHAALTGRMQQALTAADLPPLSWYELLWAVERSPTRSPRMSELAEWLTLSRGGVTKLVDRLEDAGYLRRVSSKKDRRSFQAELTPAGENMLGEMHAVCSPELERHLGALTAKEAGMVTKALERVTASTCEETTAPKPRAA